MKKQYKSSIIKNHKITKKNFFGCSLNRLRSPFIIFRFCARNQKRHSGEYQVTNDA